MTVPDYAAYPSEVAKDRSLGRIPEQPAMDAGVKIAEAGRCKKPGRKKRSPLLSRRRSLNLASDNPVYHSLYGWSAMRQLTPFSGVSDAPESCRSFGEAANPL
jgi:hypothetical protein